MVLGIVFTLLTYTPGQAQTVEELQKRNQQLEAELQQLKADYGKVLGLTGPAKKEILAMAEVLGARPAMAIDFSNQSGEMCLNPGQGAMTHYTMDVTRSKEDLIYMLEAQPFIDLGLQVGKLPKMPTENGKMEPFQWYYYDGKTIEPHHGRQFNRPMLIMGIDVK
jgi:hypothetical protein